MRRFLELLHRGACPAGLTSHFPARIGRVTFDALVAAGILPRGDPAEWYPCPGGGEECPRRIVENPGDDEHPFVAVPGAGVCCKAVPLREEDLAQHTTSIPNLVRALREVFGLHGGFDLDDELFPCTVRIGQTGGDGLARDVLLATWPTHSGFEAFLRSRRTNARGTLVLAPARSRWLRADIDALHGPGERVELAFLEDLVEVRDGRLQRRRPAPPMVREPTTIYGEPPPPFCMLVAHDGRRPIGEEEYRTVVARADGLDLFIDTMTKVEAGRYRASRRDTQGSSEETALTFQQAHALIELVERRKGLRAAELSALSAYGSPEKQVEAARRAVDVKLGRYQWRALHLLKGDEREANRYLFNPPEGFRFAVVRPLDA